MRSRMDKYFKDNEVLQRTSKNDSLYEELYRKNNEPTSNVTVLDNINEIDITKIKDLVDSRENYKKVRQYESLMKSDNVIDKKENIEYEIIDDSNYDINQIIEKKKSDKDYSNDITKIRKINDDSYNALTNIEKYSDEDMEYITKSVELRELVNTIAGNEENSSTDLFANLKSNGEETKENVLETVEIEETKETTFYTKSDSFNKEDFNEEILENEKDGNKGLVIITIIFLFIAIGVFVWFKFFQ